MLVHHFLDYYARNNPDLPCLTQGGVTSDYGEIASLSRRLANGLLALGISKGQRIAVLGENSREHLLMLMAASRVGAVLVSLNYRLAPGELAYIIGDAQARVLLTLDGVEQLLPSLRVKISPEVKVFSTTNGGEEGFTDWLMRQPEADPVSAVDAADPLLQLYTSGTTGNPKGVVSSHFNALSLCTMNDTATPKRANAGMATVICAPLFHIGGMGSLIISIFTGVHTLLHKAFDPVSVVDDMEAHPVINVFMVPAMIMAVLQIPGIEERDFSRLGQIFYGASPISESVLRKAIAVFGCEFIQMYGMTETTGTVVNLSADDHRRALAGKPELLRSCGRPSVGAEARVMDLQGNELPRGEVGEIWLKSETNMISYYNLPEATDSTLTDGWVHTGDAGYMDEEGYLYLKDRIKDMVVSGGENIYPVEVENALARHEAVADVAVIGVPDQKFGEALLAFVVLNPGGSLELDEMIAFCREHIAGYKIPRQLEIVEALPRNPSGKILKKILREPYWKDAARGIG